MSISRILMSFVVTGLTALVGPASAQQPPAFGDAHPMTAGLDESGKYYDFKSAINGRAYRLFVSIPDGTPPNEGFPVMYVLDGNIFFATASESLGVQSHASLKPAVIVGIGYPTNHGREFLSERTKDLTTPISADRLKTLRQLNPALYVAPALSLDVNGGMDDFLRLIEQEVKPFIKKLAPINSHDQTIFGHSFGGLTVIHALFTEPTAFQTFIASSPSIWWNDDSILRDEASFKREVTAGQVEPRVLIDVGGLEQEPGTDDALAKMVSNAVELGKRLAKLKGGAHYVVKTIVFAGETHTSVMPAAMSRALGFAFGAQ